LFAKGIIATPCQYEYLSKFVKEFSEVDDHFSKRSKEAVVLKYAAIFPDVEIRSSVR
jgi:hypothetical protein